MITKNGVPSLSRAEQEPSPSKRGPAYLHGGLKRGQSWIVQVMLPPLSVTPILTLPLLPTLLLAGVSFAPLQGPASARDSTAFFTVTGETGRQ